MKTQYKYKWIFCLVLFGIAAMVLVSQSSGTSAVKEGEKVTIIDQTGERWDITQAVSIGFDPRYFEFGIGRNAFNPLGESNWKTTPADKNSRMRVIGVTGNGDAHAYSVAKLWSHETASTFLGAQPIVAGYWPLVDLAAVYSRVIDGQVLTLAPSGWTYKRTFVLYDKETGTLWYPQGKSLIGIQGKFFKKRLPMLESTDTKFYKWVKENPATRVMQ